MDINSEFVSALSGALFGSGATYILGSVSEHRKAHDGYHSQLLEAQLRLLDRIHILKNLKLTVDPFAEKLSTEQRTGVFSPKIDGGIAPLNPTAHVEPSTLGWLVRMEDANPALFLTLTRANNSYSTLEQIIEDRNRIFDKLRDNAEGIALLPDRTGTGGMVRLEHVYELQHATKEMVTYLDRAIIRNTEAFRDLRKEGLKFFPPRKLLAKLFGLPRRAVFNYKELS